MQTCKMLEKGVSPWLYTIIDPRRADRLTAFLELIGQAAIVPPSVKGHSVIPRYIFSPSSAVALPSVHSELTIGQRCLDRLSHVKRVFINKSPIEARLDILPLGMILESWAFDGRALFGNLHSIHISSAVLNDLLRSARPGFWSVMRTITRLSSGVTLCFDASALPFVHPGPAPAFAASMTTVGGIISQELRNMRVETVHWHNIGMEPVHIVPNAMITVKFRAAPRYRDIEIQRIVQIATPLRRWVLEVKDRQRSFD